MSCCCKCPVTLPHGAVGWSAACDFGFFLIMLTYFLRPTKAKKYICISVFTVGILCIKTIEYNIVFKAGEELYQSQWQLKSLQISCKVTLIFYTPNSQVPVSNNSVG